jgi:phosphate transport system substrate-binding protein
MKQERNGTTQRQTKPLIAITTLVLITSLVVVGFSGCTSQQQSGTIKVSGAYSLYPMMVVWANEYQKNHTGVRIDVSSGGAGKGMSDALAGTVNLGMVSRDVTQAEKDQGIVDVAVVKDAVLPTINDHNPVLSNLTTTGLTNEQFRNIFINLTYSNWGQLVNKTSITNAIKVYSRSDVCGAAQTWAKYLSYPGKNYTQDSFPTSEKVTKVKGDDSMSQSIISDPNGIGYSNVNYIYSNSTMKPKTGLVVVPIDINGNGKIDANESFYATRTDVVNAEINDTLPSPPARLVYLVTLHNFTGITKDFVQWILTTGQKMTISNGYAPVPTALIPEQLRIIGVTG